jgi:predicted aldo/keto reductase-like oxidoreductase
MRLPRIDDDWGRIDEPEATRMVRYAVDHGVNYVDTAYPYHHGASESFLGRALQDGYRQRVRLATKMPCWEIGSAEEFDRYLDEQLEKLQVDRVDFYLLHGLRADWWEKVRDLGVLGWAEGAMAHGRIGHLGFSFHDRYEVFREIVEATDLWTFCQIQYNYMDVDYQAGARGLEYAADRGLAVIIMEPLRGGQLTNSVPPSIQAIWAGAPAKRTPAEWALQWLWSQPAVSVVLSGMSTMDQVQENIASATRSRPGLLTDGELAVIGRVKGQYEKLCPIPCTGCRYCQPCPSGVNIPGVFEVYSEAVMYEDERRARVIYNNWIKEEERAHLCTSCSECLTKCPQGIGIPDRLAEAHDFLYREEARDEQL